MITSSRFSRLSLLSIAMLTETFQSAIILVCLTLIQHLLFETDTDKFPQIQKDDFFQKISDINYHVRVL